MKKLIPEILLSSVMVLLLSLQGCKNDTELQTQLMVLGNEKVKLINQKDSVIKLLANCKTVYDTLTASYNNLAADNDALKARIRSLQAGVANRDKQIKAAEQEKATLNNAIAVKDAKNDSLGRVIASLNNQIAGLNRTIEAGNAENKELADIIKVKNTRILADSLAEVERLSQPKENGFVNLTEITGGIGFAKTHVDYSSRIIGVSNIFGYQINKSFLTGLGVGVYGYNGGILVPLYLDMRYYFKPGSQLSPYVSADGGLQLNPKEFEKTTIFINPTIGLKKKIGEKSWLNFGIGTLTMGRPDGERSTFFTIKGGISIAGKKGPKI